MKDVLTTHNGTVSEAQMTEAFTTGGEERCLVTYVASGFRLPVRNMLQSLTPALFLGYVNC